MKIPQNNSFPIFKFNVPSLQKKLRFRPFLMRENKALLIAQVTDDSSIIVDNLKNVIASCCLDNLDPDKLATYDIEYLLCMLRCISVGNAVTLALECDGESEIHDSDPTTRSANVVVNLENVEILGLNKFSLEIKISPELIVKMRPPILSKFKEISDRMKDEKKDDISISMEIIANQIDTIYTKDEAIDCKDLDTSEILEWINSLTMEQYNKLDEWFSTIPVCQTKVQWKCRTCGKVNTRYIKDFSNFF